MFEKELEEYKNQPKWKGKIFMKDEEICFKDGIELGYNKANEWHYTSKSEYPEECKNVLCYCKGVNVKFYTIGHTIIGGDNIIRWWSSNRAEGLKVYAWKEITPPKGI